MKNSLRILAHSHLEIVYGLVALMDERWTSSASAHPSTRGWSKQKSVTKKEMRGYHAGDDFS
jgi:hypothetical protein